MSGVANGDCLKLTTWLGERERAGGRFLADALLDLYGVRELAVSVLLRGVEGFGAKHRLRTDRLLTLSEDLPLAAVAVDARERIERVRDEVLALGRHGLVTVERARLLRPGDGVLEAPREPTRLTVYLGRQERVAGRPAFVALCELLHRRGIAGASVLLGVDGTVHGRRQRARFLSRNAEVPLMVLVVGDGERIAAVLPELEALLRRPLMTLERVQICKRDGELLERPGPPLAAATGSGPGGGEPWQKLTVFTSEHAHHDGQPIHRALVRALRESGAAGATALRGIWGFHGDHAPHGDRFLQLGRRVPVVTTILDTPARIAQSFELVDELTAEHGLVTCETVPGYGSRISTR
jgi:PII-like signaling protein